MKRIETIKIEANSKGAKFFEDLDKRKKQYIEKFKKRTHIPADILEFIKVHTELTAKLNGENFDKRTFRLGMMSMYYHLKNKLK